MKQKTWEEDNQLSESQKKETAELYNKIKDAILSDKDKLQSMENGVWVVLGALASAIGIFIKENVNTKDEGAEILRRLCVDLMEEFLDSYSEED